MITPSVTVDSSANITGESNIDAVADSQVTPIVNQVTQMPAIDQVVPEVAPVDVIPAKAPTVKVGPLNLGRRLFAGIVVAFMAVLALGASAFGFTTWYQSPQKVITDAIISVISAKSSIYTGDLQYDSNGTQVSISVTAKQADSNTGSLDAKVTLTASGQKFELSGAGLVDSKGDLYIKISNIDSLAEQAKALLNMYSGQSTDDYVDSFVNKVNNTWIKISSADLKQYSDTSAESKTCLNTVSDKYKNDSAALTEIYDLYGKNEFIVIGKELG